MTDNVIRLDMTNVTKTCLACRNEVMTSATQTPVCAACRARGLAGADELAALPAMRHALQYLVSAADGPPLTDRDRAKTIYAATELARLALKGAPVPAEPSAGRPRATELEWLKWFYQHADFGPADTDVRMYLKEKFMQATKKNLPERYNFGPDGETTMDQED